MKELIKFGIAVIIFLIMGLFLVGQGSTNDEMTDEQFEEEYNKTLIGEIDYPINTISIVTRNGQDIPIYEPLENPYIMADLHRKRYTIFFTYTEECKELLEVDRIVLNESYEVLFIQDDDAYEDKKKKSFMVFGLHPDVTIKGDTDISVTIFYKDNKLGLEKRYFEIEDSDLDDVFRIIIQAYESYKESEVKL